MDVANLKQWAQELTPPVTAKERQESQAMFERLQNIALGGKGPVLPLVARAGDSELLKYLIDKCGKDVKSTTYSGSTLLVWATRNENVDVNFECARMLLDRGVGVNAGRFEQESPLIRVMEQATTSNDPRLVPKFKSFIELLLSHGADPDYYSSYIGMNDRPLYVSAESLSRGTVYEEVIQAFRTPAPNRHWLCHARNMLVEKEREILRYLATLDKDLFVMARKKNAVFVIQLTSTIQNIPK